MTENNNKAPSWSKLHNWFVDKLSTDGTEALSESGEQPAATQPSLERRVSPITDYQAFLENASRTMIRFKKPEHLIKMIVRTIDEQLQISHTAVLLYKEDKRSYILIDSKGS